MPAFGEHMRPWYPGIIPAEAELWRAWLREHEAEFEGFEYNVHVGEGVRSTSIPGQPDDELTAKIREQFRQATQMRIDAIGFRKGETWIFEIEDRPGRRALGQMIVYESLLPRSRPDTGNIVLCLIAVHIGPDMLTVFQDQGVVVYQLPA